MNFPRNTRLEHVHGEEEAGGTGDPARPVRRQAAAGNDAVDVRMVIEVLAPSVEDREEPDLGAEMARDRARSGGACRSPRGTGCCRSSSGSASRSRAISRGSVKTTWKYSTGRRSRCRSAIQRARAFAWHFGQWRLRQEL